MMRYEHLDYADEAESAERAEAWPQALALWRRAIETCPSEEPPRYAAGVARCERQIAIDAELASIARRVFGLPTLESRKADSLDFHEVAVWDVLQALRLAYRAGQTNN